MNELYEKSIALLELPKVLEQLAVNAVSDAAKAKCLALLPSASLSECARLQEETAAAVFVAGLRGSPSFSGLKDVTAALDRAEKGGMLNMSELLDIAGLLRCARSTRAFVEEKREKDTVLDGLFSALSGNRYLEDKITAAIISPEEIADTASDELYDIRRKIRTASSKVRDVLTRITSSQSYSKMLQDSIITQRQGRFVVPVKAEYKGAFGGLVHDVSSSGATLFIEPSAVVELNNDIRVLTGKEKAETERILLALSAEAAQFSAQLTRDFELLCELDFIFARAKLAYAMDAMRPEISREGKTEIKRARHPLLPRDKAVPISFFIGGDADTVVITGPNTGGKTVSLKTLGLLTLMAQCGLFIPASEESRIRIFDRLFADIGDEQSIEQSLSTFSAHMKNIVSICSEADEGTLVLLDELGAGTDPVEGAALAVAIIEHLRRSGAAVAATTHYAELKVYALETKGVVNASCEFDVTTLMPTYKLVFGIPGKSNAFAIAGRLGLPGEIIAAAEKKIDDKSRDFENVIAGLQEKRQALESRIETAERQKTEAERMSEKAKKTLENVEGERERIISEAKKQAQEIIGNARAAADLALSEARRTQQDAKKEKEVNIAAARAAMMGALSEAEDKIGDVRARSKPGPLPRPLRAGDTVEIAATGTKATVLEAPTGNEVKLQAGIMNITVDKSELRLLADLPKTEEKPKIKVTAPRDEKMSIDVRGQTADDAILEIERYLDNAQRRRLETVTIIHGKGTGVLRQKIQSYLRKMPQVKSFRNGVYGEGEMGVTVVTLKL